MNKVLSLLVAFVFLQTQCWALSGGPVYRNSSRSYVGTYAGVLIPTVDTTVTTAGSSAQIGLFGFAQPETGFTQGVVAAFVEGSVFTGTIQGVLDPKEGTLHGILDATNYFVSSSTSATATSGASTTAFILGFAKGSINAKVTTDNSSGPRVEGTAVLDVLDVTATVAGSPVTKLTATFQVDGFQQSLTATTPAQITRNTLR